VLDPAVAGTNSFDNFADAYVRVSGSTAHELSHSTFATELVSGSAGALSQFFSLTLDPGDYTIELGSRTQAYAHPTSGFADGSAFLTSTLSAELTAVPLPAAAWLLLFGLGSVAAFARQRRPLTTA
jgi:hypothetical protein